MAAIRRAESVWEGDLRSGNGALTAGSSGAFKGLPVTWASRTEQAAGGKTSPEELLAAAHASCFSMALAVELSRAGARPQRLEVSAAVTFDQTPAGFRVVSSVLDVRGWVDGIEAARFDSLAAAAKDNCPVSQAFKGNVRLEVHSRLLGGAAAEEHAPH